METLMLPAQPRSKGGQKRGSLARLIHACVGWDKQAKFTVGFGRQAISTANEKVNDSHAGLQSTTYTLDDLDPP